MVIIVKDFDTYKVKYFNFKEGSISKVNAVISCYNANQNVGVLLFVDTYPIPYDNTYTENIIHIYYHTSHFNDIIDILRYEKPLRLALSPSAGNQGSLLTLDFEPAGEQE